MFQFFLPIVLLIITVLNARSYVQDTVFPPLKMTLSSYNNPITLISGVNNSYYQAYIQTLQNYIVEESDDIVETMLFQVRYHVL